MREIVDIVRESEWRRGEPLALATLVRAQGSSYRRPGARMLVAGNGRTVGSLSGGCLEEEVAMRGREVLRTGAPAWLEFDTRRHFGCHGAIEIFVEYARSEFLRGLADCVNQRRSTLVATVFGRDAADAGSRFITEMEEVPEDTLVQRIDPSVQLIVVGDGPDSAPLRAFAETLGWRVIGIESASELCDSYDGWTVAVIKTHNYGRDFAALRALLPLGLPYVGLLGPRRRRDQLLGDLLDTGFEPGKNLFAPAGLDLGGESPEAVALAIIAEIHAVLTGASREFLGARRQPIHADTSLPLVAG